MSDMLFPHGSIVFVTGKIGRWKLQSYFIGEDGETWCFLTPFPPDRGWIRTSEIKVLASDLRELWESTRIVEL